MNLRILGAAEAEIKEARDYLDAKSVGLGQRFIDDLIQALSLIAEEPLHFPKLETMQSDQPYRRALLTVFRYAVVFEVIRGEVVVIAVCHASREPNYWLSRDLT